MKTVTKISLIALMLASTIAFAEDSVDAQIQEIKNAPQQERVKLMNQFKLRLGEMNQEDRADAIEALRTQTQTKTQTQTQTRSEDGEGSQFRHQNQVQQMNQTEQMNQIRTKQQDNRMDPIGNPNGPGPQN